MKMRNKHSKTGKLRKSLCVIFAAAAGALGGASGVSASPVSAAVKSSRSCVEDSNIKSMQQKIPSLYKDFQLMRKLPLTGMPVYKILTSSNVKSCLVSDDEMSKSIGGQYFFDNNTLEVRQSYNNLHIF